MGESRGSEIFRRRRSRRRVAASAARSRSLLGVLSLAVAIVTVVIVWIGVSLAMSGNYVVSTNLAYLATGTSVVAVIGGVSAVLLGRGRPWGFVAVVLGLLTTPLLLTHLLAWASSLG